jgi:hypothetical protein
MWERINRLILGALSGSSISGAESFGCVISISLPSGLLEVPV